MSFFGIHNHSAKGSNLRLRDSTNKIDELIDYYVSLRHMGLALTEHESITSSLDALKHVREGKSKGVIPDDFKIALGNEIYLCQETVTADNKATNRYPHFILIALNSNGHKGIRELSTKSWTQNCFSEGIPLKPPQAEGAGVHRAVIYLQPADVSRIRNGYVNQFFSIMLSESKYICI